MFAHAKNLKKKEKNEISFFRAALMYLNKVFSLLLTLDGRDVRLRKKMEEKALLLIRLIDRAHDSYYFRQYLYDKIGFETNNPPKTFRKNARDHTLFIRQLKNKIEQYRFVNKDSKWMAETLLEQILRYYQRGSGNVKFIENKKIHPPWLAYGKKVRK